MIKIKEGDVYEGQIHFSTNGNASLLVNETEVFIFRKNTLNSFHLDNVKIEIIKGEKKLEGKVIDLIARFKTEFVGKVHINKDLVFVIPDSNKMPVDFYIKGGLIAKNNQKVIVELVKWKDTKSPQGKIIKILGDSGDNNAEMNSIMYEYGLPVDFPKEVECEANEINFNISEEIKNRKDMRDVVTITIDPVDAKDFDDALSIDIKSDNKIEIGVHIADVSHYVKVGTKLDDEALKRATSVYLVDRCVPMLPEILSNGVCSLRPNEDKLCFSVILTLDEDGNLLDTWFGKTLIHSNRRFTYEEAQDIVEGNDGDFYREVRVLNELAKKIRKKELMMDRLKWEE